jgi:hypothetical protein
MLAALKGGMKRWKTSQVSQLLAPVENTGVVMEFLEGTRVGQRADQEPAEERREERSDEYGWNKDRRSEEIEEAEERAPD